MCEENEILSKFKLNRQEALKVSIEKIQEYRNKC